MKKFEVYGLLGSLLINGSILLLLLYFTISASKEMIKPQEEMVEVMFGDGAGGAGAANPGGSVSEPLAGDNNVQANISQPSVTTPSTPAPQENVMSQVDESEVSVSDKVAKKPKKEELKSKSAEEKLKERKEFLAQQEAIRQQQIEEQQRQAKIAQANAIKQDKINKANAAASVFGNGSGGGTGNGVGSGSGSGGGRGTGGDGFGNGNGSGGSGATPGNPLGHGSGGGNSWTLTGRSLKGGLNRPSYVGNQEGKIIVSITVDKNGNVVATGIAGGTTISDEKQRAECKAAALRQKFTPDPKAPGNVIGTITYNFKFEDN